MTTFLLLLSLMLNAAAIFAIILLYLRQNRLVQAEKKQARMITEIEEVFSSYLLELKEENEKFIQLMKRDNPANRKTSADQESLIQSDQRDSTGETQQTDKAPRIGKGIAYNSAMKAYRPDTGQDKAGNDYGLEVLISKAESAERPQMSFNEQVTELHNQGLTAEDIARRLNKGKTEIELLLKFRQNT